MLGFASAKFSMLYWESVNDPPGDGNGTVAAGCIPAAAFLAREVMRTMARVLTVEIVTMAPPSALGDNHFVGVTCGGLTVAAGGTAVVAACCSGGGGSLLAALTASSVAFLVAMLLTAFRFNPMSSAGRVETGNCANFHNSR